MAKLFPIRYFYDTSGQPLAGGKIYTYVAGSSTPKKTYTDASGETPHANPIELLSDGSAAIWMDTDSSYKLVIKDADDTQIGNAIDTVEPTVSRALSTGGANIDTTGYAVVTTSNDDIRLNPNGTGNVKINNLYYLPSDMPDQNAVLASDGTTTLVWSTPSASALDSLSDVTITSAASGNVLKYNGSAWVNAAQSTLSVTASQVSDLATAAVAFTNKTGNISQWTNDSGYITASSASALTNKTGNISQWTNDSGYAALPAGSQANAEAETSSTVSMTPLIMQNHPGVAKAFLLYSIAGGIIASHNIASVAFVSGTTYTVTFTTAFSNSNYAIIAPTNDAGNPIAAGTSRTTSSFRMLLSGLGGTFSLTMYGDQ